MFFAEKKTPGGHAAGLAPAVWSYPLAFRSLVVKHTALTQNFQKCSQIFELFRTIWDVPKINRILILLTRFQQFPKTQFAPKMTISMTWSCRSVLPSQNVEAHLFHVQKKHSFSWLLMISPKEVFRCSKFQNVVWKPTGASTAVFTCPKFQNVVWKPTGLTKRTF